MEKKSKSLYWRNLLGFPLLVVVLILFVVGVFQVMEGWRAVSGH